MTAGCYTRHLPLRRCGPGGRRIWLAWTPVLAIGCGIAAGYILTALFPADSAVRTWEIQLLDLGALKEGLKLRLNSTFIIGAILILVVVNAMGRGRPSRI